MMYSFCFSRTFEFAKIHISSQIMANYFDFNNFCTSFIAQ